MLNHIGYFGSWALNCRKHGMFGKTVLKIKDAEISLGSFIY